MRGSHVSTTTANLGGSKLTSLQIGAAKIVKRVRIHPINEVVKENTGVYGSICYVIRRPGCGLCREDGLALNKLASVSTKPLAGFGLFGVVKEAGVIDPGLATFHKNYFPFPLYRDDQMAFYNALGNRRLSIKDFSPFNLSCSALGSRWEWKRIVSRLKKKNIRSTLKGEGFIQGGLIFFGPDGTVRTILEEQTGSELSVTRILSILNSMKASVTTENKRAVHSIKLS